MDLSDSVETVRPTMEAEETMLIGELHEQASSIRVLGGQKLNLSLPQVTRIELLAYRKLRT